ncbi:MAG: glycosyltransferase family 4 protein [Paracoccaceae bacterium]
MAITKLEHKPRCLDVTRLVSRAGAGPMTGVDRVELAYLRWMLGRSGPIFALARTATGFVLLERAGMSALLEKIETDKWGEADLLGRLSRRLSTVRKGAEADLRRLAAARSSRFGLRKMLMAQLPVGTRFFNTGHSNLTPRVMNAVGAIPGVQINILLHDFIPLDFPDWQGIGTVEAFREKMQTVSDHADLIICNSEQTLQDAQRWLGEMGRIPASIVAHLGIDPPKELSGELPQEIDPNKPYFVVLGTIEPRKNHALLLDIWDEFAREGGAPAQLVVVGRRGWKNEAVFARLDKPPKDVVELSGLSDGAVQTVLKGSVGLLFPSFVEGFGLPPAEAAALNIPVICNDLAIYREFLGDYPVYLDVTAMYLWKQSIRKLVDYHEVEHNEAERAPRPVTLPNWEDHFKLILSLG